MKRYFVLIVFLQIHSVLVNAQNIGIGTTSPKAVLDVNSTTSGFLPPRMTIIQRNSITNPTPGLIIFCTECDELQIYNGSIWKTMTGKMGCIYPMLPNVIIENQVWSVRNLDVTKYRNGDPIPQVADPSQWANLTTGAWCWGFNDSTNFDATFGKLYNWYAVNDPRGLAPEGWHVPTDAEWNKMTKYLDPTIDTSCLCWTGTNIGAQMKNTTRWYGSGNGSNSSGFSCLPSGYRLENGAFSDLNLGANFWTSSNYSETAAMYRWFYYDNNKIFRHNHYKNRGFSVRVVKD